MPIDGDELLKTPIFRVVDVKPDAGSPAARRQVIRHPGAVTVVPELDDEHLCLIRNYRISVDQQLLELPAGTRKIGESPEATARRELIEETGYRAERLELLATFYTSPGIADEKMFLYLASGLMAGAAAREPGEQIVNRLMTRQEALDGIATGTIVDAKTIIGLLMYDRHRRNR